MSDLHVIAHTWAEQNNHIEDIVRAKEHELWKEEAQRLREVLEDIANHALEGKPVVLLIRDKRVKLVPESTAPATVEPGL